MKNPQHIWTSTTLKLDEDLVHVMLGCNGIAKIQIGGVDGFYIYMPGSFSGDPRKVAVAYKKQVEEIEAGFARIEKEKNLPVLIVLKKNWIHSRRRCQKDLTRSATTTCVTWVVWMMVGTRWKIWVRR